MHPCWQFSARHIARRWEVPIRDSSRGTHDSWKNVARCKVQARHHQFDGGGPFDILSRSREYAEWRSR